MKFRVLNFHWSYRGSAKELAYLAIPPDYSAGTIMDTFFGRYKNLIVLAAILFAQIVGAGGAGASAPAKAERPA